MTDESPPPSSPATKPSFFEELKRRKVYQMGVSYAVAGWMIVQITVAVFPQFDLPAWASRFVILAVAAGFPIVLLLAWAFELTPVGLLTTRKARLQRTGEPTASDQFQKRRTRLAVLAGALLPGVVLGAILGAVGLKWWLDGRAAMADAPGAVAGASAPMVAAVVPLLAVLPFENMSPDPDNAFFASGVHEDLLTNLSRLGQLRVISRTSILALRDRAYSAAQIATELGATHVIEGSVRRLGDRVRVTAQLVAAGSSEQLWADRYDRELNDIFAIQSQLADEIAHALRARLSPSERAQLRDVPTHSVAAYDLYLKARDRLREVSNDVEQSRDSIDLLERAVQEDPDFATAWSQLAWAYASSVHFGFGDATANLAAAEHALAQAKRLAPDRVETRLAETYVYYHGHKDLEKALAVVQDAIRQEPGHADLLSAEAYILRRMGRLRESLEGLRRAATLDPLNAALLNQMLGQVRTMGLHREAHEIGQRMLALIPDNPAMVSLEFGLRALVDPDLEATLAWARRTEDQLARDGFDNLDLLITVATVYLMADDVERAEQLTRFADQVPAEAAAPLRTSLAFLLLRNAEIRGRADEAAAHLEQLRQHYALVPTQGDQTRFDTFGIWLEIIPMVIALRDGDEAAADARFERVQNIQREAGDILVQAGLQSLVVRAEVLRYPERSLAIYHRERGREFPGVTFETAATSPLEWADLIREPAFRAELQQHPAHLRLIQQTVPFLLE